ncbi:Predicted D-lactate dehydrogenase, Fe-S protein, FAD/FMN-containing [[Actinomadura] parvosata subsp. kistnae]|uniref:D-lactate dehydrogenase (cytochrome) n=1 Tax=[Actinomadura] parvosata subsp. kistnae TaxID=1909395 RepID=A0A1V0A357_9ACTN|nr:FAD-binding and (Fe-S)-binding domain-containing protein [Nonomuraea sp. ATCC 55076]AQZ64643.1 FAD-binding oxidoreductase [Nonomuraea sp. ATCC 55076]SPL99517.1 Predicted D-lactate dehydrogenase, Fe-S protein, FAD/FMN-containing [Actinomadura parvosata subsp. kistnae]
MTLIAPDPAVLARVEAAVPGIARTRASDRLGLAHDASHYLLTPQAVLVPESVEQVAALLRAGLPLTFRSGGTSLSGQAVSEHLLVDTRRHFRSIEVLDGGARVRVQPGAVLRQVNARLAPYGRKLGPDPASESACTIGGVVANNSSGMTCGTHANTYRTLESMTIVLPSGTVIDTGAPDADERLRTLEPALAEGLARLRDRVRNNPDSVRRIQAQFSLKNTMGYGLNSLLDHDTPAQILAHLVIGSEGTLGFVAEAVFRTVPAHPLAATGLLVFPTLHAAMAAMPHLVEADPAAVELLDAESLRVARTDAEAGELLRSLDVAGHAALLVEWQESEEDLLAGRERAAGELLPELELAVPAALSRDAGGRAALWHIRKGLYASVAGARPSGTTALLEDVAVPVPALAGLCDELTALFARHRYERSVIFGHAKDGNLHFMLNERFDTELERYAAFTEDMVEAVLSRGGTLKAEHGTGRVMAPFVRRQYGDELYEVMREVKRLCDPAGTLNPGVVLTDRDDAHLRDLKAVVTVEPEVDRCVECGYCEPVCPSRDLTTTPRQRIVLRREQAAARAAGDHELARELEAEYGYDALDTCAVDGMCATACPVLINTGDLTKRLRAERHGRAARQGWKSAARHWDGITRAMNAALDTAAAATPPALPEAAARAARAVAGPEAVPQWSRDLPRGGMRRRPLPDPGADVVYLPSCLNTMFAPADGGPGVMIAFARLARRAGVRLHVPEEIGGLCCGTPWSSKGFTGGHEVMAGRVRAALLKATDGGRVPVVSDAASCTEGFQRIGLNVTDAVAYTAEHLLPRLTVERRLPTLAVHPTCSSTHLGLDAAITAVARAIADEVTVPEGWQCCAFAGDRGLLHPELTASATRAEAAAVRAGNFAAHASVNRTCELGLTRATGEPYHHLLELLDQATTP